MVDIFEFPQTGDEYKKQLHILLVKQTKSKEYKKSVKEEISSCHTNKFSIKDCERLKLDKGFLDIKER